MTPFDTSLFLSMITDPETVPWARLMLALAFYAQGGVGPEIAVAALTGKAP